MKLSLQNKLSDFWETDEMAMRLSCFSQKKDLDQTYNLSSYLSIKSEDKSEQTKFWQHMFYLCFLFYK